MRLDRANTHGGERFWIAELLAAEDVPGLERLRLDRLLELRAVIDSLRTEHAPGPSPAASAAREQYGP